MQKTIDSGPVIHRYTRAQALADGVLVDGSAYHSGQFRVPVAFTSELWAAINDLPYPGANVADRAWDVLWLLYVSACKATSASDVTFQVGLPTDSEPNTETLTLHSTLGPDDDGAPVLTVGFPSDF
jgi:hypothetical protein